MRQARDRKKQRQRSRCGLQPAGCGLEPALLALALAAMAGCSSDARSDAGPSSVGDAATEDVWVEADAAIDAPDGGDVPRPSPDCALLQSSTTTPLPKYSGTLPATADMTTAGGSSFLYVLTQWGFARASLIDPAKPGPFSPIVIGHEGGTPTNAVFDVLCDCHQGSNTMDVAESADGTSSRLISDWQPYAQGGAPGSANFSGTPAQLVGGTDAKLSFGQQIELPTSVPLGARVAAAFLPSTGKYFGYFPTPSDIRVVDLTNPTGSANPTNALSSSPAIDWASGVIPGSGARLRASAGFLFGATVDKTLHAAKIDPSSGALVESGTAPLGALPMVLDVARIEERLFVFAAELSAGLEVFELLPSGELVLAGAMPGSARFVAVRGNLPFPVLFVLHDDGGTSFVDLYDTTWLTRGTSPVLLKSLPHLGAKDASYRGFGFEAVVTASGSSVTAYLHRQLGPPPPGLPVVEYQLHTDVIDLSCLVSR